MNHTQRVGRHATAPPNHCFSDAALLNLYERTDGEYFDLVVDTTEQDDWRQDQPVFDLDVHDVRLLSEVATSLHPVKVLEGIVHGTTPRQACRARTLVYCEVDPAQPVDPALATLPPGRRAVPEHVRVTVRRARVVVYQVRGELFVTHVVYAGVAQPPGADAAPVSTRRLRRH